MPFLQLLRWETLKSLTLPSFGNDNGSVGVWYLTSGMQTGIMTLENNLASSHLTEQSLHFLGIYPRVLLMCTEHKQKNTDSSYA